MNPLLSRRDETRLHRISGDVTVGERTALNAAPVDPAIRTTHMGYGIFECVVLIGT
jgi:hypothetical protein